jgi:thiamine pyrophosphate-dependent acetolactate synthase large subunit-like protein
MDRVSGTRALAPHLGDAIAVTGLGYASWALHEVADRDLNLYLNGSMGLASSVALGLARARPERQVVALEGDGSLLMNLGSLATIGAHRPPNLTVVVWDDGLYLTTGGQSTHTRDAVDLAAVARGCGIARAHVVDDEGALSERVREAFAAPGPALVVAKIGRESTRPARCRLPTVVIRHRLQQALGTCRCHGGEG